MIKAPSLVREYTWIWSGDPALDAPPDHADAKQKKAWAKKLENAQDYGTWDALLKPGQKPTRFTLRIVPGSLWRELGDGYRAGRFGDASVNALTVRLALKGISDLTTDENGNSTEVSVEFAEMGALGSIAKQEIVDVLDAFSPMIVNELANYIAKRQAAPSPK